MSWYMVATVVVTAVAGAKSQRDTAKVQSDELEREAEQEKISAEGRELERRQKLNRVLSSNIASLTDSGIVGEGSAKSISLESAKQASVSEGLTSLSDRLRQSQLRRQGKNIKAGARVAAASTLLSGAAKAVKISKTGD